MATTSRRVAFAAVVIRGMQKPQYRLRIEDVRVFYDVVEGPESRVEVLAIVPKEEAAAWLEREGLKS